MFGGGYRGQKLKTNLRLAINRCKLLEKKKTEIAMKERKDIADYLSAGKDDRAKIRVEHIIREDYYVEAMEIVELYCDLLLARYGMIESMKVCDESLLEAVSSLIWVEPRMRTDVQELKTVAEQLVAKYGKEFGQSCRSDEHATVNPKMKHRLSVKAPPKTLVENYLIEIAKNYNVPYEPDQSVLNGDDGFLLDLGEPPSAPGPSDGASGGSGGGGGGGGGGQKQPLGPPAPYGSYPPPPPGSNPAAVPPYMPPHQPQGLPPPASRPTDSMPPSYNGAAAAPQNPITPAPPYSANDPAYPPQYQNNTTPYPQQNNTAPYPPQQPSPIEGIPELPSVPAASFPPLDNTVGGNSAGGEDVDFDDLSRRFEELKKKK